MTRELHVRCLPGDIPDSFPLDVSELEINSSLHVSDIAVPEGVEILTDPEATVVSVAPPAAEEVIEEEEEDLIGEAEEPELIGAKGGEEESEEADE